MDIYRFLLDLALILFTTKTLGIIMKKIGLPQVLGALLSGVILGVSKLVNGDNNVGLELFSTIGVNLIMFSAGMETNLKEIKKNGIASILITVLGVIIPLLFGFGVSFIIPNISLKSRWFIGVILTATSVGITVSTLKELGVLHGKVGASIVTAAILDDIIGIIILAFFTANVTENSLGARLITLFGGDYLQLASLVTLLNVILFFAIGIGVGILIHFLFKVLSSHNPHTRRLSIFGLVICFVYAWGAEKLFGVAAITGSFLAGMMIAHMPQSAYVEKRIDTSAYMMFSPIFFAYIGISMPYDTLIKNFNLQILFFSLAFVAVGLLSKLIGCGLGARICKYKYNECFKVGIGMMVRGEVCLIVAKSGEAQGLIDTTYFPAIVFLIIISSILVPILLKLLFKKYPATNLVDNNESINTVVRVHNQFNEHSDN